LKIAVAGVAPEAAAPTEDPGEPFNPKGAPSAEDPQPEAKPQPESQAGSFATISLRNELDGTVNLVEIVLTMDGKELPPVVALGVGTQAVVFAGKIAPGQHVVRARLRAEDKPRGPFTYMKGYAFNIQSDQVLTVPENKHVMYTIAVKRNKGMNVAFDKQIGIDVRTAEVAPPQSLSD
jgi:hypothetical protein